MEGDVESLGKTQIYNGKHSQENEDVTGRISKNFGEHAHLGRYREVLKHLEPHLDIQHQMDLMSNTAVDKNHIPYQDGILYSRWLIVESIKRKQGVLRMH